MAPGSQATADVPAGRSGGKMLKAKRTAPKKTPYDRPTRPQSQPPLVQSESPSWLTGLVSPAKVVAGGASKILSSFWNPKTWGAPSSSSSDSDSESEDDSGDDENPSDRVIELNQQKKCSSSEKSETLHLVEQLLMLEQYSREECDRLIEIINSRVVDYTRREGVDAGPSMVSSRTNNETPDNRNQAIMEAKKWIEEKKVRSGLKSDLDDGTYALRSVTVPQTSEGEAGSPVDVAKSYMRARPPWASPINHNNPLSPSPLTAGLFKDGMPYSSGSGISLPSAKRDYLSAGSWNIQDEIRRLRSKATEDMLNSHRSMKSTLEHDTRPSLAIDMSRNSVARDEPTTLEAPKSGDELVNLDAEDMRTARNDFPTEALLSHPAMPALEEYQGMESVKVKEGQAVASNQSIHSGKNQNTNEGNELEKKDEESNKMVNDLDKSCYLMTEATEVPVVDNSEDTNEQSLATKPETRAATRASRHNRRGKARGK